MGHYDTTPTQTHHGHYDYDTTPTQIHWTPLGHYDPSPGPPKEPMIPTLDHLYTDALIDWLTLPRIRLMVSILLKSVIL